MALIEKREFYIEFGDTRDHSLDYLVGILNDTRKTTILTIQNLTIEELDWQYKEGWNSIGALLSHMVAIEHYFRIVFVENRRLTEAENVKLIPALDMGANIPLLIKKQPIDQYVVELNDSRQQLLASLKHITFEDFQKTFVSAEFESKCNLAWLLYHRAEDEIYHRGQISMIKKLQKVT